MDGKWGHVTCCEYVALLEDGEIAISMSRRGNPYDNARAERFMRTLKEKEVAGRQYRDPEDARYHMCEFLEQVYNRERLHSALRYVTPEEFERGQAVESAGAVEALESQRRVSQRFTGLGNPCGIPTLPTARRRRHRYD